jgi:glycosyltransferase involved in cell wall biosynthesis
MNSNRKIKVALMSYAMDNRPAKGTAIYTRRLIEHLVNDNQFEFTLIHYEKVDDKIYRQVKEVVIPQFFYPSRWLRQLKFFWQWRRSRFDIIHWFQPRLYPGYWWAPATYKVVTIHGGGKFYYPKFSFSARVFDWVLRFLNQSINCAIVVSSSAKKEAQTTYGLKADLLAVTHNGGSESFQPISKTEALLRVKKIYPQINRSFILNISRLQPHKNINNLILGYIAMRNALKDDPLLVIIGQPTEKYESTYKLARESNYRDDIIFINYVDQEYLNDLYSAATIFVFPSLSEGFGIPIIEAFAAGTPVVASSVSSLPEIVGEAGILADPCNPQDLARAMLELLNDKQLRTKYRDLGLARAKLFTWAKTAEATKEIYLNLIKHGRPNH